MLATKLEKFIIKEQEQFNGADLVNLRTLPLNFEQDESEVKYLGLSPYSYAVSYYIGIDWLKENETYLMVEPKIEQLDYVKMFMHCLNQPDIHKFLKDIYFIDFNRPEIAVDTKTWQLNPFLIAHFIFLLEKLTQRGLRSNYVYETNNLQGKIRGKIDFSKHLKKNIFYKREDRIWCNYNNYVEDCFENRLLKRTLIFVLNHFDNLFNNTPDLLFKAKRILALFDMVSSEISHCEIKKIRLNSIYKHYTEAIKLAQLILKDFGYSFSTVANSQLNTLPPFWIDMSKLFELYVYSKLKEAYPNVRIDFQAHGKYGFVDFLDVDNKIIIDTKYKLCYAKERYKGDDIRQLSGYARDIGILKKLGYKDPESQNSTVIDCVIIAPDENSPSDFINRSLIIEDNSIKQFTKFYWTGIKLPTIS